MTQNFKGVVFTSNDMVYDKNDVSTKTIKFLIVKAQMTLDRYRLDPSPHTAEKKITF